MYRNERDPKSGFTTNLFSTRKMDVSILVKSHRDLTRPGPPKGSLLEGKSPAISGKSRLVKYYAIWPDTVATCQSNRIMFDWATILQVGRDQLTLVICCIFPKCSMGREYLPSHFPLNVAIFHLSCRWLIHTFGASGFVKALYYQVIQRDFTKSRHQDAVMKQ